MNPEGPRSGPLLSICVPTFNRASSLRNLFRSLGAVKARYPDEIEICISNNGSPDDTREVLAEFQAGLDLKVVNQSRNIGGTLNIIAVTQMMAGEWGLLVGDDDELAPETIGELLKYLKGIERDAWVLVESAGLEGKAQYLARFARDDYDAAGFRKQLLGMGLNSMGFMGVHVIPRSALPALADLTIDDSQPWPHVAGLLRTLVESDRRVCLFRQAPTLQAKGGAKLFWNGGDLARIRLAKIRILARLYKKTRGGFSFFHLMMLRELYAVTSFTALMAWKLYEPADFRENAVATYLRAYSWMGICAPLSLPHAIVMLLLRLIPDFLYAGGFSFLGKGHLRTRYLALKAELGMFDGIKRGI
jgi:glycosyltransferase involved in cell wall biosynthesis